MCAPLPGNALAQIIAAMIRSHTPYDAALHARSQLQHGSWVLQLQPKLSITKDAS